MEIRAETNQKRHKQHTSNRPKCTLPPKAFLLLTLSQADPYG